MTTRAFVQKSGEEEGSSQSDLIYEQGRVRLAEVRTPTKGRVQRVDVVFDPETLHPISWIRRIGDGADEIRTELQLAKGQIEARTLKGGKITKVSTVAVPEPPWCVAPLVKFQAALCVAASGTIRHIRTVAVREDGSLKLAEMKVEYLGLATVTVPAGEFRCHHLRLTPQSKLMTALVPDGAIFLGEDGTHPMVKTILPATPLSSAIVTELQSYTVQTNMQATITPQP